MTRRYDPDFHHRRSVRLKGHDYSTPGMYFVTICTWERRCLLGEIHEHHMVLNEAGTIVDKVWQSTASVRPCVALDEYVVMPNHLHGIIILTERRLQKDDGFLGVEEGATLPAEVGAIAPIPRESCDAAGGIGDRTVRRVALHVFDDVRLPGFRAGAPRSGDGLLYTASRSRSGARRRASRSWNRSK